MAADVAILYDFLQVRGGAERVSLDLLEALPESELWVAGLNPAEFPDPPQRLRALDARPLPAGAATRALRAWARFERIPKAPAPKAMLFSGHYAPLAAPRFPQARRALYLHAPPLPFAYDPEDPVRGRYAGLLGWPARRALSVLAQRYSRAVTQIPLLFANSAFTAAAFASRYGRQPVVLPPPVDLERFQWRPDEGYFLSFARLEPDKRIDRLIAAFRLRPQYRLIIAGDGSQSQILQQQAVGASNIRFLGALDPVQLAHWLGGALATLCVSRAEPFGLCVAESLASGKPVIVVDEGGLKEIVEPGRTGLILPSDPSVPGIADALDAIGYMGTEICWRENCQKAAMRYDARRFVSVLSSALCCKLA